MRILFMGTPDFALFSLRALVEAGEDVIGVVTQPDKPKGSKETHVCLATWEALTGRGIKVRASGRDSHHPLKRPCDTKWEAWMKLPERCYLLPDVVYLHYRLPFENGLQFKIKFHK